jgi:Recombination endonuclease VII
MRTKAEADHDYYVAHKVERAAYRRRWYVANRGRVLAQAKEYGARTREQRRAYVLSSSFGLTSAGYDAFLAGQGGLCAICRRPETAKRHAARRLAVDHDHATGDVRGLLCSACNHGIGLFADDPARLRSAATYIEVARGWTPDGLVA